MLKSFWHRRAVQKSLNAVVEKKQLNKPFTIKRVRVLLDAALKIEQNFFIQLAKELGLPPVSIHVFVFPSKMELKANTNICLTLKKYPILENSKVI